MSSINPNASKEIDQAFAQFTGFQKECCIHLRALIHKALPDVKEDWKWGPNFNVNGMVCGVWGFKNHVKMVFFKGSLMKDPYHLFNQGEDNRGNRSINFMEDTKIDDTQLMEYVKEAAALNTQGAKPGKKKITVEVPAELQRALSKNKSLSMYFEKLAPSHRREYSEYVTEAKQDETRDRRVKKVLSMLEENKTLHEKYMKRRK